jgi:hypothetical protein
MHQSHPGGLSNATRTVLQVAGTCSVGILWAAGTPWWVKAVCIVAGFGYAIVQAVFPQHSADRLAWWEDRRLHKERLIGNAKAAERGTLAPRELG